jgi:hypothetical protein
VGAGQSVQVLREYTALGGRLFISGATAPATLYYGDTSLSGYVYSLGTNLRTTVSRLRFALTLLASSNVVTVTSRTIWRTRLPVQLSPRVRSRAGPQLREVRALLHSASPLPYCLIVVVVVVLMCSLFHYNIAFQKLSYSLSNEVESSKYVAELSSNEGMPGHLSPDLLHIAPFLTVVFHLRVHVCVCVCGAFVRYSTGDACATSLLPADRGSESL